MTRSIRILCSVLLLAGCSTADESGSPELINSWKDELLRADMAFNDATAQLGAEGWVSFFSPEGSMISEGVGEIHGREAIESTMTEAFSDTTFRLTWEPVRAEVSRSGDLGYTVGRYRSTRIGALGQLIQATGMYVSIWRRQPDGSWKVEMDLGNPTSS